MELSELIKNAKLPRKEREINFWSEKYNQALKSLGIIPIMGEEGKIQNNKIHIKRFNEKYPFYPTMLELIERESDEEILKSKVVQEIISYLEITHKDGNILVQKGNLQSISKKKYGKEKNKILKDLKLMLYQAFLRTKRKASKKNPSINKEAKQSNKSPGRKPYSDLAVFALKYHIIHRFNKFENPYSDKSRFKRVQDFYEYVATKENLNKGSFSNKYKEINREPDLERYCKSHPQVTRALSELNCFQNDGRCFNFLSQYVSNMK